MVPFPGGVAVHGPVEAGQPGLLVPNGEAWATVKTLYQLETTEPERAALQEMLATC